MKNPSNTPMNATLVMAITNKASIVAFRVLFFMATSTDMKLLAGEMTVEPGPHRHISRFAFCDNK